MLKRYDFGTAGSPLAAGYTRVMDTTVYTATLGHGWQSSSGLQGSHDRGTPADPLLQDLVQLTDSTFVADLPTGDYDITLTTGDGSFDREQLAVFLEGTQLDTLATPAGQFATPTYRVAITDGQLTLRLHDQGGATPTSAINGLQISQVVPPPPPPAAPSGLGQSGDAWVDGVTFTWTDNATDEDSYLIEWSSGSSDGWHIIDELPANSTSYTDEYPVIATDNYYRVTASRDWDELITSLPSNEISVYPKAPAVAWWDNNGGANERGTLSPHATVHDKPLTIDVLPNDVDYDNGTFSISDVTPPPA